ncbi:MAG TPA: cupredoxin domain-containing protein [Rhodopila sp.]|uniref:cupredoxin domain-containing protein n=1 Tax=Rhodopila sp. TaxID=2480087 RepID=UPI002B63EB29|nr:cupredoxin domain-containing protein [Rhodopila sp.]HVY17476.1 cupredoxin domain-containing protein [Rhodopila sp.]
MRQFPGGLDRVVMAAVFAVGFGGIGTARADDVPRFDLILKDHKFTPAELHIPSGKRADLHVHNQDNTAEEFDSSALKVEKVIPAGASAVVRLRPLAPGRFPFMGEFHPQTARGVVVAE